MTSPGHFGGIAYAERTGRLVLHLSIGADLLCLAVDRDDFSLTEISRLALPAPIQYVWPHPTRNLLYVATSNRSISKADDRHALTTVELDDRSGTMTALGEVALPTRPLHLTLDAPGRTVLVAYNAPALVTAHRIDDDGVARATPAPTTPIDVGVFPHQVRMLPSGRAAVIVARGNHAGAHHGGSDRPEEPGSLEFVAMRGDRLTHVATVAPGDGFGFGPRHLAFHPQGRWAAVSMERQNELQVFEVLDDRFSPEPAQRSTTLHAPSTFGHAQLSSALNFHPSGRFLYVANRNDTSVYGDGREASDFAGNNVAVYRFDAATGRAEITQHLPTESVHVRTFSLDASGRLLVTASILPALWQRDGAGAETVPSRLTFFRVGDDGRLALAAVRDMPNGRAAMFWSHLNGTA